MTPRPKQPARTELARRQRDLYGDEQSLVNAILSLLALRGVVAWRVNSGSVKTERGTLVRLAPAGTSDIIGIVPPDGKLLAVEAKIWPNTPTPHQEAFLERVRAAGGMAIVAYSVEDVDRALGEAS
jgi:hypothetical protein